MKNKILFTMLLAMSLIIFAGGKSSAAPVAESCFGTGVINGTELEITSYDAATCGGDVDIPATISGMNVTRIGDNAFKDKGLTNVVIPDGVTQIGDHAFENNAFAAVALPSALTSIGNYAFSSGSLASLTIPDTVTQMGQAAFAENQLTSVTLSSLNTIPAGAFAENKLTSMTF